MMSDITICIKTFERLDAVTRLLNSIITLFNYKYTILIADDSKYNNKHKFDKYKNLIYYHLPYDSGLSAGRNFLIDKVKTTYFIICDDDFIFTQDTKIEKMKNLLIKYNLDILGGRYNNVNNRDSIGKNFKIENNVLYITPIENDSPGVIYCDMVPNFFIAKTKKIKKLRWDESLKIMEHSDFFIRAKNMNYKVGYINDIYIIHDRLTNETYNKFRNDRAKYYKNLMKKKYNLTDYVFLKNKTTK